MTLVGRLTSDVTAASVGPLHVHGLARVMLEPVGKLGKAAAPSRAPQPRQVRPVAVTQSVTLHRAHHAGAGQLSSPGLVSVVPTDPSPIGVPPRVATQASQVVPHAVAHSTIGQYAPPMGFWFAVVLSVLLCATARHLAASRRPYRVALSITKR
jgi:hypothetical protein